MDKSFYNIVFTITIIIAILVLAVMGVMMLLGNQYTPWPPDPSECPDYWNVNPDRTCSPVASIGNVGSEAATNPSCAKFDPNTCGGVGGRSCTYQDLLKEQGQPGSLKGDSARCRRQIWANTCGVYWDGISDISPMDCAGAPPATPSPGTPCDCSTCKNLLQ